MVAVTLHSTAKCTCICPGERQTFRLVWLCSTEELSVAIDNTETPFGRLPWAEPRCPYVSDHKCCFQPLDVRMHRTVEHIEVLRRWHGCDMSQMHQTGRQANVHLSSASKHSTFALYASLTWVYLPPGLQCDGICEPNSACPAPVFPSRPPLPPYKLEVQRLPRLAEIAVEATPSSAVHAGAATTAGLSIAAVVAVAVGMLYD